MKVKSGNEWLDTTGTSSASPNTLMLRDADSQVEVNALSVLRDAAGSGEVPPLSQIEGLLDSKVGRYTYSSNPPNLNELHITGIHWFNNPSQNTVEKNFPYERFVGGMINITSPKFFANPMDSIQILFERSTGKMYYRALFSSTWSPWSIYLDGNTTGWRVVENLYYQSKFSTSPNAPSGLRLRREGDTCMISAQLRANNTEDKLSSANIFIGALPTGFRTTGTPVGPFGMAYVDVGGTTHQGFISNNTNSYLYVRFPAAGTATYGTSSEVFISAEWKTSDDFPKTFPGVAV